MAAKFNNNGSGVRGDMKAVVRAILLDSEARSLTVAAARLVRQAAPSRWCASCSCIARSTRKRASGYYDIWDLGATRAR